MKNFQFIEGRPASQRENQENGPLLAAKPAEAAHSTPKVSASMQITSPHKFPSTPGARIPLADLIGDAERPLVSQPKHEDSPEEQIRWNTTHSPRSSQPVMTPGKSRKRARSSSPPSTARQNKRPYLGAPQQPIETPTNDPATDLWNKYTTGTTRGTPLAFLANSSSPRIGEEQVGNVSGLRRWTSCGVKFPTSASKRKRSRQDAIREQVEDVFTETSTTLRRNNRDTSAQLKNPRIGSLLERIQQSFAQPPAPAPPEKAPSSTSPTPGKRDSFDRKSVSPLRAPELAAQVQACSLRSESASFGSDLDADMLDAIEKQQTALPPGSASLNTIDEFEEDDDFDDADLEQMASLCDQVTQVEKPTTRPTAPARQVGAAPLAAKQLADADDFGFDDDDDIDEESFAAAELAATQSARTGTRVSNTLSRTRAIQRYLIKQFAEGTYTTLQGRSQPEKVVVLEADNKVCKMILLRQSWFDTRCSVGSYVHVIGQFDKHGKCVIDDAHNMVVLHPDHLISALVVADSFTCLRRAVLQDRIKATSSASPPQVYGTMLHEIFQAAIVASKWDDDFLYSTITSIVSRHLEDLYELNLSVEHVTDHLLSKMPEVQSWAQIFVQSSPGPSALVKDRNDIKVPVSIAKVLDVEEHIWSPAYGLKGNIDATVQLHMRDEKGERTLIAPLEIKTGKNTSSTSHRAQTALYTLLLSDRYDVAVAYGILYYMENSETTRIPGIRHEIRHMIMQRNELACYVKERLELPPMIRSTHACDRCYAKTPCYIYHKLIEDGDGETSGMREKFDKVVRNLSHEHAEFFKKWEALLTKEESEMMKFRRELWTMVSTERQKLGRCFANVILEPGSGREESSTQKINRYQYAFIKREEEQSFSFSDSQLAVGEPIVVSDEEGHYALAKGYVTALAPKRVTVAVDRRLHNARARQAGFDQDVNQVFSGITDPASASPSQAQGDAQPMLFRLDKDEFSNGMATVRNNLVQIMDDEQFQSRAIRDLIIGGKAPRFKAQSSAYSISGPPSQIMINADQQAAIERIMAAEDYALVLGMPGTGKTTTIAHIIRALVANGKSVLLTSYTHTAVDNILLKIRQDNISVLRLGSLSKIHPEVREFATLGAEPKTSVEEIRRAYHEPQVVATTCLGTNHHIFTERTFDFCVVDEASQITLPVCLGPIRLARAFVLVGDHYQLPPLVQNKEALEGGLDVSLFKLLSEQHPSAVAMLHHQYRMNGEIMSISNQLIYKGMLVCGSEEIARRRLELPAYEMLHQLHDPAPCSAALANTCTSLESPTCWIGQTVSPTAPPVTFLNTDTLLPASQETLVGSRLTNSLEASLVVQTVRALIMAGVDATAIGVITLYRSQLALIKSLLSSSLSRAEFTHLEAHTTDRFQGRDKDVVVMSCVRSNERAMVGDLLKDWRRVNVAVTRAKKKLIIIGSRGTLSTGDELLGKLTSMCQDNGWMVDVPASARDESSHRWPMVPFEATAQSTRAKSASPKRPAPTFAPRKNGSKTLINALKSTDKVNRPFKAPAKVGKRSERAVLGSENVRAARPVLADIVNDVVGEGFFD